MFAGFDIMFSHLLELKKRCLFLLIVEIPRKIPVFFFPRNKTRTEMKNYIIEKLPLLVKSLKNQVSQMRFHGLRRKSLKSRTLREEQTYYAN